MRALLAGISGHTARTFTAGNPGTARNAYPVLRTKRLFRKSGVELKRAAALHLVSPLLWTSEENALGALMDADSGSEWRVIEVGPGNALSGFWRDSGWSEKYAVDKPVKTG